MSFIKRGDGKILSVVDEKDDESKKSAKEAAEKIKTTHEVESNKKSGS